MDLLNVVVVRRKMKINCAETVNRMKLSVIITILAIEISQSYATSSSSGIAGAALKSPQKHRTAKLVRDLPRNLDARLQTIEFPSYNIPNPYGPGTYAFGYEIEDPASGNVQFRDEEKLQNGTVRGSYGYLQPDGSVIRTRFIADLYGYRANTEIRQADGQVLASIPTHETMETQASNQDNVVAEPANQYPTFSMPPTYGPALNPNYIDPSYTQAILNHIKDQQYLPTQGYLQNPYGMMAPMPMMRPPMPQAPMFYDTPSNGNIFSNFFSQFPSNLAPSNIYNNLQTTFPNFIPQQNPLNTLASNLQNNYQQFAQNNPFNGFITNAQSSFQQLIPPNNPFAGWFNPNSNPQPQLYLQQSPPQLFNRPGSMVYGDTGVPAGVYSDMPMNGMNGNRVPTTKRRGVTTTRKKNGYKTRDGSDWLDDFLENRKREVVYGVTTGSPTTASTVQA